jgi:hypothetical protein
MKNKVKAWIRKGCPFNEGLTLLPSGGYLDNFLRICRIQGETPGNKEMLLYQLCRASGISEKEAEQIRKEKPRKAVPEMKPEEIPEDHPILTPSQTAPMELPEKNKIRQEFPFLSEASCPDEFKIMVADKITAYYNYIAAHERLFQAKDISEIKTASRDVLENFIENRQIYEELQHYKLKRKILGKHPVFQRIARAEQIKKMKVSEMINLRDRLKMNIWRTKKSIDEEPGSQLTRQRTERLKDYEFEFTVVNNLIEGN